MIRASTRSKGKGFLKEDDAIFFHSSLSSSTTDEEESQSLRLTETVTTVLGILDDSTVLLILLEAGLCKSDEKRTPAPISPFGQNLTGSKGELEEIGKLVLALGPRSFLAAES
ncbi:hypothetical protein V2J09_001571 [Rumex salicifolius]